MKNLLKKLYIAISICLLGMSTIGYSQSFGQMIDGFLRYFLFMDKVTTKSNKTTVQKNAQKIAAIPTQNTAAATAIEIKQFESLSQQSGTTCGYYTLANAKAVQTLINQDKAITQDAIKIETRKVLNAMALKTAQAEQKVEMLETDDYREHNNQGVTRDGQEYRNIIHRAHGINLENAYFIAPGNGYIIRPSGVVKNLEYGDINQAIRAIKILDKGVIHLPCNLGFYEGGHWVYIGIVKESGKQPYILHLNSSANAEIAQDTTLQGILNHIRHTLNNNTDIITANDQQLHQQEIDRVRNQTAPKVVDVKSKRSELELNNEQKAIEEAIKRSLEDVKPQQPAPVKKVVKRNYLTEAADVEPEVLAQIKALESQRLAPKQPVSKQPERQRTVARITQQQQQQKINDAKLAQELQKKEALEARDAAYARQLQQEEEQQIRKANDTRFAQQLHQEELAKQQQMQQDTLMAQRLQAKEQRRIRRR